MEKKIQELSKWLSDNQSTLASYLEGDGYRSLSLTLNKHRNGNETLEGALYSYNDAGRQEMVKFEEVNGELQIREASGCEN